MSYPYDPDTALSLFNADHQQHINEVRALRQAKPNRKPSGTSMRRAIVATAVAVAIFATAGISTNRASATFRPTVTSTCDVGGTYRTGCQLIPGRPDGWHNTNQHTTVTIPSTDTGSLKFR